MVDVFEDHKPRTVVPPGSHCEYGQAQTAVMQLSHVMQQLQQGLVSADRLADEVQVLLTSPGMSCTTPEGARVVPKAELRDVEGVEELHRRQDEILKVLLASLPEQQQQQLSAELAALVGSSSSTEGGLTAHDGAPRSHSTNSDAGLQIQPADAAVDGGSRAAGVLVGGGQVVGGYYDTPPDDLRLPDAA